MSVTFTCKKRSAREGGAPSCHDVTRALDFAVVSTHSRTMHITSLDVYIAINVRYITASALRGECTNVSPVFGAETAVRSPRSARQVDSSPHARAVIEWYHLVAARNKRALQLIPRRVDSTVVLVKAGLPDSQERCESRTRLISARTSSALRFSSSFRGRFASSSP